MCGVTPASINGKVKSGTLIINSGKKLDTDNPVNREYLTSKQNKQQLAVQAKDAGETAGAKDAKPKIPEGVAAPVIGEGLNEAMLGMTLGQLVANYGGTAGIERFAKTLQTLTSSREKELRIQERRQELVPKDWVTSHLFGYIDQLMNKLLDWPEGAADTIIAKVLANKEEGRGLIVNYIRDGLARCISDAKLHVISELNGLRGKYDAVQNDIEDLKDVVADLKDRM